jgi:hypothetical protein
MSLNASTQRDGLLIAALKAQRHSSRGHRTWCCHCYDRGQEQFSFTFSQELKMFLYCAFLALHVN